jgi:lipopolysaccharide transport system ATP-binding protein
MEKDTLLSVEDISKNYRLGAYGAGSLRREWQEWIDRRRGKQQVGDAQQELQALENVSFQINRGEAVGIIGSNGSGKSTILKIISRIIRPSSGRVRGRGTISSLLEVGTGFHYELSGRENIYISGYTLGMKKEEIRRKFDEIVAFSGVERFLDTPVKRYSSGMYVRLAFAVSAHLEPDMLIVDEVLAVGDAEFQKKCLGKMETGSRKEGRTILFVSHHLQAVEQLCSRAIWLEKGKLMYDGGSRDVVQAYRAEAQQRISGKEWDDLEKAPGNERIRLRKISAAAADGARLITVQTAIRLTAEFKVYEQKGHLNVNVTLETSDGQCLFSHGTPSVPAMSSMIRMETVIPGKLLNNRTYWLTLTVMKDHRELVHSFVHCLPVDVEDDRAGIDYLGEWPGLIRPKIDAQLYVKDPL